MPSSFDDVAHLLRRAGFGGHPSEINALTPYDWAEVVDRVLTVPAESSRYTGAVPGVPDLNDYRGWSERYTDMVSFWLERARLSRAPIVEKMVLFWHGHLCSALDKVYDHQLLFEQNQIFRSMGMGSFPALLKTVSLHPAMVWYLDNDQNHKDEPNENFARELMELFTLGFNNQYTEQDVRESARAWTGYGLNDDRDTFVFDSDAHDDGQKTFMGTRRNWNGPEIIDHIVDGPTEQASAEFLCGKLWSFFAYPDPEPAIVSALASAYISGSKEMVPVLRAIFNRPEFRSTKARRGLVRSPIEFAVAAMRQSGFGCADTNPQWALGSMGQAAYNPPNVSGWRQNDYWISPTALWAKRQFINGIRWKGNEGTLLGGVTAQFPYDFDQRPAAAQQSVINAVVESALSQFGLFNASDATRTALRTMVQRHVADRRNWAIRPGLILVTPLSPEFQMA